MGVTFATTMTPTNASDAQFRAYGSLFSGKLSAIGLSVTADTGQINWTTVLAPVGTQASQGYEIWKFTDALQATVPVIFKIEYGSGSAINNPSFWITVGSGSNGTGTITGITSARQQITFSATATPVTFVGSGDTNRLSFAVIGSGPSLTGMFSMERSVDTSGTVTNEAVLLAFFGASAPLQRAWNCVTGPYTAFETTFGAMSGASSPNGSTGTQVAIYPVLFNKGVFMPYGYNLFCYVDATIGAGVALTFAVYGVNHTYYPIGATFIGSTLQRSPGSASIMIRFD